MTINEHVALATDKVAHWNSKRDHALAMLTKWQARLSALPPTAAKLPPVVVVPTDDAKVVPITDAAKTKGKKAPPKPKK